LKIANADEGKRSKQKKMRERELYIVDRLKEIGAAHKTRRLILQRREFFPYTQRRRYGKDIS
jgi:DUF438 domain-containing protein